MKAKKLRIFAVLLSAAMCLGLLAGCGGDTGGNESPSIEGNTVGAGTVGKDSKDDALFYLTTNNEWVLTKAADESEKVVVCDHAIVGGAEGVTLDPNYIPGIMRNNEAIVWFTSDGSSIYFYADIDGYSASIYHLDRSALKKDYSNVVECVSLVCENVLVSVNNQLVGNGILFRTHANELYYYNGKELLLLARDVIARWGRDELPSSGTAAFALTDGGKSVVYTVKTEDGAKLCAQAVNGNGDVTVLSGAVTSYFCDSSSNRVIFTNRDNNLKDTVYTSTLAGEVEELTDNTGHLISAFGGRAYYTQRVGEYYELRYYDGQEAHVICGNVDYDFAYGDAETQIALYLNRDDKQWYSSINGKESMFSFENSEREWQFCGVLEGGKEIVLCETSGNQELVILSVSGDSITSVTSIATGCWRVHIRSGSELCFIANESIPYGDFMLYCGGELATVVEDADQYTTNHYSDNVVLTIRDGELVQIKAAEETHIANGVRYFLRIGDGNTLYISTNDTLYLHNGFESVRLSDGIQLMFCASGEYNSGAMYIEHPEFGDSGSNTTSEPAG